MKKYALPIFCLILIVTLVIIQRHFEFYSKPLEFSPKPLENLKGVEAGIEPTVEPVSTPAETRKTPVPVEKGSYFYVFSDYKGTDLVIPVTQEQCDHISSDSVQGPIEGKKLYGCVREPTGQSDGATTQQALKDIEVNSHE